MILCRRTRVRKRAFTLIELLVTVLIIAVLLAILLPQLSGVRASAGSTKCLANLRQSALSMSMYAETHRRFPLSAEVDDAQLGHLVQSRVVAEDNSLIVLPQYFRCPLDDEFAATRSSYSFVPARFMRAISDNSDYAPTSDAEGLDTPLAIVRMFDGPNIPVFQDVSRFHVHRDRRIALTQNPSFEGMQTSYFDGSARLRK